MELVHDSSQVLLEGLYESYSTHSKRIISNIRRDRELSQFNSFNKRLKISWGMRIQFTDSLPIKNEDTRACYELMLKIADLWSAFEHLTETVSKLIEKDKRPSNNSKVDLYQDSTMKTLGFDNITLNFNELLWDRVLHTPGYRNEIYMMLAYLKNGTKRQTQKLLVEAMALIKERHPLQEKHIFALAYGIRNIYLHDGVAAALGHRNHKAKRALYLVLHDSLILYSLTLGDSYCQKYLQTMDSVG
jgi:hypothetical protein